MPAPVLQFKRGNAGVAGTVPALRPGEPAFSLNNFDLFVGFDTSVAGNKFFGSHRYWGREDGTTALRVKLVDKNGTNSVNLKAPDTLAGIATYTLPASPIDGYYLKTNSLGVLEWSNDFISIGVSALTAGITTFTDVTDNTLGNADTGAVQVDGGLGVNKNVTVGGNLNVQGYSEFVGVVTFKGGVINLGDSNTDDIVVAGEFKSNLTPTDDASYDIGNAEFAKRWRNANFSGIGSFADGLIASNSIRIGRAAPNEIDTLSGNLIFDSTGGTVDIQDQLTVTGISTFSSLIDANGGATIDNIQIGVTGDNIIDTSTGSLTLGSSSNQTIIDDNLSVTGIATVSGNFFANGNVTLGDASGDTITIKGTTTFEQPIVGTIGTATRALTVDTTTAPSATYYPGLFLNSTGTASTAVYVDAGISYVSSTDTLTLTGDLAVNGGDINTSALSFNLVNANATTVNAFGAASNLNIGANNGTLTIGNQVVVGSNATQSLYNTVATTVDAFGAATNISIGDTSGTLTLRPASVLGVNATQGLYNSVATTINAFGAATAINMGANSGTLTIGNPTVVGTQATQNLYNTTATTVNAFGAATNVVLSSATGITTVRNKLTVGGNLEVDGNNILASDGNTNITLSSNSLTTFAGDIRVNGNDIQASDGNSNITMTSNTLTAFAGDIRVNGNDIQASDGATNITLTSNTLTEIKGDLQVTGNDIKSSTGATVLTMLANDATFANNLTVSGNLYVNGSTTQVNTSSITVEDRTIELGIVDGSAPSSSTSWDLGVLFNYHDGVGAKKSAVVWEYQDARFKFATTLSEVGGTSSSDPQITVSTFAPIEVSSLWINNSCSGGAQQVIGCVGSELQLQNIVVDAGTF